MPKRTIKLWLARDTEYKDDLSRHNGGTLCVFLGRPVKRPRHCESGYYWDVDNDEYQLMADICDEGCEQAFGNVPNPGQLVELTVTMEGKVVEG